MNLLVDGHLSANFVSSECKVKNHLIYVTSWKLIGAIEPHDYFMMVMDKPTNKGQYYISEK